VGFEHDLYDQLQLIQVLDAIEVPRVSLVCRDEYLGMMAPKRTAQLYSERKPVGERQFGLAREGWAAFRSSDPMRIRTHEREGLPYLGAALRRFLEEYPWTTDRKSRLERRIGEVSGKDFEAIFREVREEPAFLGGVRLDQDSPWRWDAGAGKLVRLG